MAAAYQISIDLGGVAQAVAGLRQVAQAAANVRAVAAGARVAGGGGGGSAGGSTPNPAQGADA